MPVPGFDDPALASLPPAGNLYFAADQALAAKLAGAPALTGAPPRGQQLDTVGPQLMFGEGTATTASGESIVSAANASRGHWSEIFNFQGSPAPWILIGILLAAGLLHLQAAGRGSVEL
jgi:hypothetical protein